MKPLVCPQCGGKITDYSPLDNFAVCGYCSTQFVIRTETANEAFDSPSAQKSFNPLNKIVYAFLLFFFVVGIIVSKNNQSKQTYSSPDLLKYMPADPVAAPTATATPNANLLEFGGKGTGDGLFQDAGALAVDSVGRIYAGDETLRVQQFDERGVFLKLWQIPTHTKFYKRARYIEKIVVDARNRVYVLVGGTILIYENDADTPSYTLESAPSAVQDFALRGDGGILVVTNDGAVERLLFINKNRRNYGYIKGFHTEAADAAMSPRETGTAAIRLAVDGAGNIFSIYALGDIGSYQLSYNEEDLMIFRFTPEGRYVDKFVRTMNSCGIEVDGQSRVYISDNNAINVFSDAGEPVATVSDLPRVEAFALDRQTNIYVLSGDKVIKRPAIR